MVLETFKSLSSLISPSSSLCWTSPGWAKPGAHCCSRAALHNCLDKPYAAGVGGDHAIWNRSELVPRFDGHIHTFQPKMSMKVGRHPSSPSALFDSMDKRGYISSVQGEFQQHS